MAPPCFGRPAAEHKIISKLPASVVNDDVLTFNTQSSSQWDGFRHFGWSGDGRFLNGVTQEEIMKSDVNGINGKIIGPRIFQDGRTDRKAAWVQNGGIVGRGVLLDYYSYAKANSLPLAAFETTPITVETLEAIARHQNVTFRRGDIFFLHTGWIKAYNQLSASEAQALAAVRTPPGIGVESSKEMLQWLWEKEFAAVAGDHPTFEAWPCQDRKFWLHEWLLAGWGMPIGELFDLERLVEECRRQGRWSFFFSSVPLHVSLCPKSSHCERTFLT